MRLLKWTLAGIALAGLAFLLGGLLLPPQTRIEREVSIARAPAQVFTLLDTPARHLEWSPWLELDPQVEVQLHGPARGPGARMEWSGSALVGSGSQQVTASEPPHRLEMMLDFGGTPFASYFELAPGAEGTRLRWGVVATHGYNPLDRWFGALLLERMIGPDLERGLRKLVLVAEGPAAN